MSEDDIKVVRTPIKPQSNRLMKFPPIPQDRLDMVFLDFAECCHCGKRIPDDKVTPWAWYHESSSPGCCVHYGKHGPSMAMRGNSLVLPRGYLVVGLREEDELLDPHANHGRGCEEFGPDEPDCPCRCTSKVHECARAGCGFCKCALPEPAGYLWVED